MKRIGSILGVIAILAGTMCLAGCSKPRQGAGKTYTFKLNYPAGQYEVDFGGTVKQDIDSPDEGDSATATVVDTTIQMDVPRHRPAANYTISMKFVQNNMKQMQDGKVVFDSDELGAEGEEIFKDMPKLYMKLDAEGTILRTGMGKWPGATRLSPAHAAEFDLMVKQLRGSWEKTVRGIPSVKPLLPTEPVTLDDSWDVSMEKVQGVGTGTATLYEVVSTPEGDIATIKFSGAANEFPAPEGMEISGELISEGFVRVYVDTGVVEEYECTVSSELEITTQGKTAEVEIDSIIKMTMKKVK